MAVGCAGGGAGRSRRRWQGVDDMRRRREFVRSGGFAPANGGGGDDCGGFGDVIVAVAVVWDWLHGSASMNDSGILKEPTRMCDYSGRYVSL